MCMRVLPLCVRVRSCSKGDVREQGQRGGARREQEQRGGARRQKQRGGARRQRANEGQGARGKETEGARTSRMFPPPSILYKHHTHMHTCKKTVS